MHFVYLSSKRNRIYIVKDKSVDKKEPDHMGFFYQNHQTNTNYCKIFKLKFVKNKIK